MSEQVHSYFGKGTRGERREGCGDEAPTISPTVRSPDVPLTLRPDPRADRRVIYFVRAVGLSLVKIGVANCVHKRVKDIGLVCPVDLEILGVIETDRSAALENQLHRRFADLRHRGEWFRETPDLLAFIASEAGEPPKPRRLSMAERNRRNAIRRAKRIASERRKASVSPGMSAPRE